MCWAMACGLQKHEDSAKNRLRKQLGAAVQSLQWSYAIFWTISTRQQGVLEWGDGYYNGDIKTRKTVQPVELNSEEMGLQRSLQLRELYESLSASDTNQNSRRPCAALSPEDLTDTEWFYLVCMSFIFNPGQGLPGRALANGHHIWLCNAHYADSKVFTRSLLAKSASIQTVVCFPFTDGVLELGVTELVSEDPSLVQRVITSFSEVPKPVCSEQSTSIPKDAVKCEDQTCCAEIELERVSAMVLEDSNEDRQACPIPLISSFVPKEEIELSQERIEGLHINICDELKMVSPAESSNECGPNQQTEDSFTIEGLNNASQVQSWHLMEEEISNGLHGSVNSSDCISQSFLNPKMVISSPRGEKLNSSLKGLQEFYPAELSSWDQTTDNSHYMRILFTIFHNSQHPKLLQNSHHFFSCESSFSTWRKGLDVQTRQNRTSQRMLKKILFDIARLHSNCSLKPQREIGGKGADWKLEEDDVGTSHILSEQRRREKLDEKFVVLKSLVPSISKVDKVSILGDTIEYVKKLERRVEELESCKELAEFEERRRKHPDIVERTSDNYADHEAAGGKKSCLNKRKACAIDESEVELNWVLSKDGLADVSVTIINKEVVIEIRCPWRECLLLEIVETITNLHLDAHSVQSSTVDNVLMLTLKSKFRTSVMASAGKIKEAIQRIIGNS